MEVITLIKMNIKNSYLVQKKNKILTTMLRSFFHMLLEIKK